MKIIVTGTSGFIGCFTAQKLLERGDEVVGIDNENNYYDPTLKTSRRKKLQQYGNFSFYEGGLEDRKFLKNIFEKEEPEKVCHLAAQAGVRYSLENPYAYIQSNIVGFHNILDLSKEYNVQNFVYASSSSVYGNNTKTPFSVQDNVDHPISLYAATKKSDELLAYTYHHLYSLPVTGLRFFTVYGEMGRPDMAYFKFTNKILNEETIDIYNYGKMKRDFTYIDDIVKGVIKSIDTPFEYEIFNLGNDTPEELESMISIIEKKLGKKAYRNYTEKPAGDVTITRADIDHTKQKLNWQPTTKLEEGLERFIDWYKNFYNID